MMGSVAFAGGGFDFAIGPKVGYQTTKLSYYKADIKAGFSNRFTAGIASRFTIGRIYIQPEVLYFNTSDVFTVTATGSQSDNLFNLPTNAEIKLTLNSMNLQVPVLVGFNILDLNVITLRAQVGPTANFVLNSKTLYDKTYSLDGNLHEIDNVTTDEHFDPKKISWGFQAGLGIDLLKRITLDINYNFGLSGLFNNLEGTRLGNTFDFSNIDKSHQNIFMVTVGIMFF
jgi:opacity protein-like surface antigen